MHDFIKMDNRSDIEVFNLLFEYVIRKTPALIITT